MIECNTNINWYPGHMKKTKDNLIDRPIYFPQDKTFKLKYCCENKNSKIRSRWCLVYQKIE